MVFKTNTQPLSDALALGVVNSNVSKFYLPSCVALVSANKTELRVNLEAQNLTSEIKLNGMGSDESEVSIFVDCLLFKQIVSTFDTSTIDLEFQEDGLTLYSGKSKFTLPKMIDEEIRYLSVREAGSYLSEQERHFSQFTHKLISVHTHMTGKAFNPVYLRNRYQYGKE